MKALSELEITMQIRPAMKYPIVISALSSRTATTYSAAARPPFPLRNFPGPNTAHVAAFRMAQSSRPIAPAVNAKYSISKIMLVLSGKSMRSELKPKPASIAAIPLIELYRPTK